MKITLETTSYNQRRYGAPWIAVVKFANNPKGDFAWGTWVGDRGAAGLLVINAAEGDIVASGQKDFRGNNTESTYYQVREGQLVKLAGKAAAYKLAEGSNG